MHKKNLLTLALLAALAACSADRPETGASATTTAPEATPAPQVDSVASADGVENAEAAREFERLFPDVVFATPMRVVENRTYTTDGGERRQGFTLEVLEGGAADVLADIREGFVGAGYTAGEAMPDAGDGVLKQSFKRSGRPAPFVAVYPTPTRRQMNPGAVGRVWISWSAE